MKHLIKIVIVASFIINLAPTTFLNASPVRGNNSLDVLRKEVTKLVQNNAVLLPEVSDQVLTVGFLINARNQLIILDVNGDSATTCAYVKQILNYNKVKYNQMRQLTRYSIRIRLVNRRN